VHDLHDKGAKQHGKKIRVWRDKSYRAYDGDLNYQVDIG
jgi:hypothetical protein